MNKENENYWLAAYLYYNGPLEVFFKDAVAPFVEKVFHNNWANQYFFIRYSERGPHVRLRFKGSEQELIEKVKPALNEHFARYFKEQPSQRQEPGYEEGASEDLKWFPNDSIQYLPYEPETERYGGEIALELSEKQFQSSSNAALNLFKETENWGYNRAMGAAVQMHLAFAHALKIDLEEANYFFDRINDSWFGYLYNFYPISTHEDYDRIRDGLNKSFEISYGNQKDALLSYYSSFWEALENGMEFKQEWLNRWLAEMEEIGVSLRMLQSQDKIVFPPLFKEVDHQIISLQKQQLWTIYYSYIHMANNRLGIWNRDEAYLGFLIKSTLQEFLSARKNSKESV